jgi:amino acid permease
MVTVGALINWAVICAVYIRFRKAYQIQAVPVVEESKSPLQPFLAWYGLIWTTFLSNSLFGFKLT